MGAHTVAGELNLTDGVKIEPPSTLWVLQEEFLSWHKVAGTKGTLLACRKYLSKRASTSIPEKKNLLIASVRSNHNAAGVEPKFNLRRLLTFTEKDQRESNFQSSNR